MAPSGHRRYLLVMRHAQRQDEVDDGWAAAEAARPGARPWDPPLSSPHGLAQAEQAAEDLAAWERHNGAHIVAVVASPFLRCLQTAAACCRRLGLPQLHLSWALSEALCRLKSAPTGPLTDWMWPRAPSSYEPLTLHKSGDDQPTGGRAGEDSGPGFSSKTRISSGSSSCLAAEEFLMQLGAVLVVPAAVPGAAAAHPGCEAVAACALRRDEQGEGEGLLAGGRAARKGLSRTQAKKEREPEAGRVLEGLGVMLLPPPVDPASLGAELQEAVEQAPPGGPADRQAAAEQPPPSPLGRAGEGAAATAAGGEGVGRWDGAQQKDERSRAPAGGEVCAATRALPPEPPLVRSVPCNPETLDAAHARYRAALCCLMAAAGASAAGPTASISRSGAAAGSDGGPAEGGQCGSQLWTDATAARSPALRPAVAPQPTGGAQQQEQEQRQLRPWRELWQTGAVRRSMDAGEASALGAQGTAASAGPGDTRACGAHSPAAPGGPEPAPGPLRPPGGGASHHGHQAEPGSYTEGKWLGDGNGNDVADANDGGQTPPGEAMAGAKSVLVVTHGEAVACAAATVAPWVMVYEVQHTGFVVLAEEEARDGGAGQGGGEGGWALLPDPHGERGVLWMSALEGD